MLQVRRSFLLLFIALVTVFWPVTGGTSSAQRTPAAPEMPDESHRLLAAHAAASHGLPAVLAAWIAQGARDEDNCVIDPYPPCVWGSPTGYHSWDPDTDAFWTDLPLFGSALERAEDVFARAVEARHALDIEAAYRYLGRAVHLLGDMATPAHVNLDTHLPPFDMDPYEQWLNADDQANTRTWIVLNPAGPGWDLAYDDLPAWAELSPDLQGQLEAASQVYGGRASGQELWSLGPEGHDPVIYRLMFLMAEEADNYDSDDVLGEQIHGDLDDPAYLVQMRDTLFPKLIPHSTALIDYFESRTVPCPGCQVFLPSIQQPAVMLGEGQ
ncbi:MAG: hypothetical protein ACK2UC_11195 [Anaerolineae bacterium]